MRKSLVVAAAIAAMAFAGTPAFADPPGAGDKQCVPGQNNVGNTTQSAPVDAT